MRDRNSGASNTPKIEGKFCIWPLLTLARQNQQTCGLTMLVKCTNSYRLALVMVHLMYYQQQIVWHQKAHKKNTRPIFHYTLFAHFA